MNYETKLAKIKQAAEKKEARLRKRLMLEKGKRKQKSMKQLKMELQRITNQIVRHQSGECYTCGRKLEYAQRQSGHHISRGASSAARFTFSNLRVQCARPCNLDLSGNQVIFAYKLRKELGDEAYEDLYKMAMQPKKWSREELSELIAHRKQYLKSIEDELST